MKFVATAIRNWKKWEPWRKGAVGGAIAGSFMLPAIFIVAELGGSSVILSLLNLIGGIAPFMFEVIGLAGYYTLQTAFLFWIVFGAIVGAVVGHIINERGAKR